MRRIIKYINPRILRFSLLELSFYSMIAAYYPFIVLYLSSKGHSNTVIGSIMSVNSLVLVFAQPIWGVVSDRTRSIKKVFILLLTVSACVFSTLPLAHSVIVTGLILATLTFFESSMTPLLDSWVILAIRKEPGAFYGGVRLWGSLGFATMVYIFGRIADIFSIDIIFPSFVIFAVLTILICLQIKVDTPVSAVSLARLNIGSLIKNYYYIAFLLFAIIIFIPHRSAFIFMPKLMETLGGSKGQLGISFAIAALSEVPIFLFSGYLTKKYHPIKLILASTVFFVLRQVLFFIASEPYHVMLIQALQGPSFALFLTGAVYYIDSLAPQHLKSFAQTFASAFFLGIGGVIGSYMGGWIIDHHGIIILYKLGIIVSIGVSLIYMLSFSIGKSVFRRDIRLDKE
ncbi:MFS transporter [Petroclostridium sp. X23]|uniref:MFS transporter n=1 Tax=Petroclostridium sp. X23 TaxID=3045146 RepID=UPI0024AE75C3|nr:MFS transporter [Petroclostridium sp. X23]WHH58143.1 MFS transporter [Petroclostridium sp. X23]